MIYVIFIALNELLNILKHCCYIHEIKHLASSLDDKDGFILCFTGILVDCIVMSKDYCGHTD